MKLLNLGRLHELVKEKLEEVLAEKLDKKQVCRFYFSAGGTLDELEGEGSSRPWVELSEKEFFADAERAAPGWYKFAIYTGDPDKEEGECSLIGVKLVVDLAAPPRPVDPMRSMMRTLDELVNACRAGVEDMRRQVTETFEESRALRAELRESYGALGKVHERCMRLEEELTEARRDDGRAELVTGLGALGLQVLHGVAEYVNTQAGVQEMKNARERAKADPDFRDACRRAGLTHLLPAEAESGPATPEGSA